MAAILRRAGGAALVACVAALLAPGACVDPTALDIKASTNVPGASIAAPKTARIVVSTPDTLDSPAVSLPTNPIDSNGTFGDLVVTPGDVGATVVIRAVLGVGVRTEDCTAGDPRCIVASARVDYALHRTLPIQLLLDSACPGIDCGPFATCVGGKCTDNRIDPNACDAGACSYDDGGVPSDASTGSIQLVAKGTSGFGPGTLKVASNPQPGDLLVAGLSWTSAGATYQVSDSAGHAWIAALPQEDYITAHVQIFYALGVSPGDAGPLTVVATPATVPEAGGGGGEMFLLEYSGVAAKDGAAEAFGPPGPTFDVPIKTQGARDLLVGMFSGYNSAANSAPAAGPGFVAEEAEPSYSMLFEDNAPGYAAAPGTSDVSAVSPSPSFSSWAGIAVAFSAR